MAKNKITDIVEELLKSYLDSDNQIEIYHIEYVKEGSDKVLRVFIDKKDGYVDTDDCERISRFLSEKLDEMDPIDQNYVLEVSSPGLDRVLITEEHFKRYIGEMIELSLFREIEGTKKLEGILKEYRNGDLSILLSPDKLVDIEKKDIAKANLAVVI